MTKKKPFEVRLSRGVLTISIGTDTLALASKYQSDWPLDKNDKPIEITNTGGFAFEVMRELRAEDEDGTTLIHRMFDKASMRALENGSEYVDHEAIAREKGNEDGRA